MALKSTKTLAVSWLAALALLAAGCGGSSDAGASGQGAGTDDENPGAVAPGDEPWCGTKPFTLGVSDGSPTSPWLKTAAAMAEKYAKESCSTFDGFLYTSANGSQAQQTSDINSLVSQGVSALIVYPTFGAPTVPALRKAFQAGVGVVPWNAFPPQSEPGRDYVDFVGSNIPVFMDAAAKWVNDTLDGSGTILFMGGNPGDVNAENYFKALKEALEDYPGLTLLNTDEPIVTKYDVATTQQTTAALLSKYSEIDAIVSNYIGVQVGALQAFANAGRKLPIEAGVAGDNNLVCTYDRLKKDHPELEMLVQGSALNLIKVAVRKAVSAYEGVENDEEGVVALPDPLFDSVSGQPSPCDESMPAGADLAADLTAEELQEIFE